MNPAAPAHCKACKGECLKNVEFLIGLPPEKVVTLLKRSQRLQLKKGDILYRQGEPCDAIYIIHRGLVKICTYDKDGLERIAGIFGEHDTIWEGVLVHDSRYSTSGICMEDVDCCCLARKDFEEAIRDPEVAFRTIAMLSRKLHDANRRNLLKSIASPKAKVAGLLLYLYRRQAGDVVTLRLEEMAGSLALRPETVSRKIKELEKAGYLKKIAQSSIQILNVEGLMDLVNY